MSEQEELELPNVPGSSLRGAFKRIFLSRVGEGKATDILSEDWLARPFFPQQSRKRKYKKEAAALESYRTSWHQVEQIGTTRLEPSLPTSLEDQQFLAEQRLKTQLMAAIRTARLILHEKEEILQQHRTLIETCQSLTTTQQILVSCLTTRSDAQVCLHEKYSGTVSNIVGEQLVVVYELDDGEPMKQIYDRKQFIADHVPREGDELCAYVFITQQSPRRALAESSTTGESEPDFSGFDKGVRGDVEI